MTCLATCPDSEPVRYAFALMPVAPDGDSMAPFAQLPLVTFDATPDQLKAIWNMVNRVVAPQHNLELGDSQTVLNVPAVAVTNTNGLQHLPETIAACLQQGKNSRQATAVPNLTLLFAQSDDASARRQKATLVVGESTPSGALHRVLYRAAPASL
jgi:hypothetical protein